MDLNFVQSDIDLASVKAIDVKELIRAINEYLLRMSDILNTFATKMENGILNLDRRLDRVEIQMILLEKKLENVSAIHSEQLIQGISSVKTDKIKVSDPGPSSIVEELPVAAITHDSRTKVQPVAEDSSRGLVKAREHENYAKYFKMQKMGVPEPAVMQKMETEGLDPNILKEPEKMIAHSRPIGSDKETSDSNDDDSFSDSD